MTKLFLEQSVAAASHSAVVAALKRASTALPDGRWLGSDNAYCDNCMATIDAHLKADTIVSSDLAEYIATSAVLHCEDGWSFLGRALDCHSRGDSCRALHFGYYAELRAAIALLATEGIGVFNGSHFCVLDTGECCEIQKPPKRRSVGTHEIAWKALREWAPTVRAGEVFGAIIRPRGMALGEWLTAVGTPGAARSAGDAFLRDWGLDLERLCNDHILRNEASYRPEHLTGFSGQDTGDSITLYDAIWRLCEPAGGSGFGLLDLHLLQKSLRGVLLGVKVEESDDPVELAVQQAAAAAVNPVPLDPTSSQSQVRFRNRIDAMLEFLGMDGAESRSLREFLLAEESPSIASKVLMWAGDRGDDEAVAGHIPVICRATLLLRLASGACADTLREAGVDAEKAGFWWRTLGVERGLWTPENEPEMLTDLWLDIQDSLDELRAWGQQDIQGVSFHQWRDQCCRALVRLGELERVALWGLGL